MTLRALIVVLALASVAGAQAVISSPTPGATLTATSQAFTWTCSSCGATAYWLLVGNAAGSSSYYSSGQLSSGTLTATATGLPSLGGTVYVTLDADINGAWVPSQYTYTAWNASSDAAVMATPTPSSTLTSNDVTFTWTAGSGGVTHYWIDVGPTPGSNTYLQSGNLSSSTLSQAVTGLPTNGSPVCVTLYTIIGSTKIYNQYTYTALNGTSDAATMASPLPADGSLTGSTVTFTWNAGTDAAQYWIQAGPSAGSGGYYSSGPLTSSTLSQTIQSLPLTGVPVYVTLFSDIGGEWFSNSYTYTSENATVGLAVMQTPANNSTLDTNHITFTWAAGTSATAYWIDIGTTVGGNNYIQSGNLGNVLTSTQATGFPANGSTMYVTLYSLIGGQWFNNRYSYVLAPHYTLPAWTAPTGSDPAASYNIYRGYPSTGSCTGSSTPVSMTKIGSVTAPTVTYTDQTVYLLDTNDYYVTAVDSAGKEGPPSNVICVVIQ